MISIVFTIQQTLSSYISIRMETIKNAANAVGDKIQVRHLFVFVIKSIEVFFLLCRKWWVAHQPKQIKKKPKTRATPLVNVLAPESITLKTKRKRLATPFQKKRTNKKRCIELQEFSFLNQIFNLAWLFSWRSIRLGPIRMCFGFISNKSWRKSTRFVVFLFFVSLNWKIKIDPFCFHWETRRNNFDSCESHRTSQMSLTHKMQRLTADY